MKEIKVVAYMKEKVIQDKGEFPRLPDIRIVSFSNPDEAQGFIGAVRIMGGLIIETFEEKGKRKPDSYYIDKALDRLANGG